jgi:adenylate kinase family enzyme
MKRILVIGPGGSGKSTFAKELGEILRIKVIHLDSQYWSAGWIEPSKSEWAKKVQSLMQGEEWILDGNYSGTLRDRLAASDTVILLDLPRLTCIWRVIKRAQRFRNRTRPDMADGCPEQLRLRFLLWIWNYRRLTRPKVIKRLEECEANVTAICLQSRREVEEFLATTVPRR